MVLNFVLVQNTSSAGTALRTFRYAPPVNQSISRVALVAEAPKLVASARAPQLRAGLVHEQLAVAPGCGHALSVN